MAPKRPGPSSAYLGAYKDKAGKVAGRRTSIGCAFGEAGCDWSTELDEFDGAVLSVL